VTERAKSSHEPASAKESIVFVIDDDVAMRATLSSLFRSVGLRVELFGSAKEFAQIKMLDVASCLVLDIRLPGVSGLDFQAELAEADTRIPIIFMTGHGDIPMSVKAMKAGAIDFLTKPFRDQDILDAVIRALERDQKRRDSEKTVSEVRILFDSLTARAGGDDTRRRWSHEQADRGQIRHHRDYCEGPSWPYDAKNEGSVVD
jgi:FixJ family two-component response regulator